MQTVSQLSALSFRRQERFLDEHGSGDTSDNGPDSVGDGVGAVDVQGLGWRGSSGSAVGSLATWWWSPSSDGDCAGRRADGCRCRCRYGGRGGDMASLEVGGSNSADESRCNGEEAHFDYLLIIKGGDKCLIVEKRRAGSC